MKMVPTMSIPAVAARHGRLQVAATQPAPLHQPYVCPIQLPPCRSKGIFRGMKFERHNLKAAKNLCLHLQKIKIMLLSMLMRRSTRSSTSMPRQTAAQQFRHGILRDQRLHHQARQHLPTHLLTHPHHSPSSAAETSDLYRRLPHLIRHPLPIPSTSSETSAQSHQHRITKQAKSTASPNPLPNVLPARTPTPWISHKCFFQKP
jgi:hypothetical protein